MKILSLKVKNRTLENCEFSFPENYCAISGKNNSGKSNLLKAIRLFFVENEGYYSFDEDFSISHKRDCTQWLLNKNNEKLNPPSIEFSIKIKVNRNVDAALYLYTQKFLTSEESIEDIELDFGLIYEFGRQEAKKTLYCNGFKIEDEYKSEEAHRKLKSSDALIFFNSTKNSPYFYDRRNIFSFSKTLSAEDEEKLKKQTEKVFSTLNIFAKKHKSDISSMLGRLQEKYTVNIGIPSLDFDDLPLRISLGTKLSDIPLDGWGSGTQNRTQILLALLNAKKASQRDIELKRIAPVVVIEEPESFLHPSAQSEFGALLRDLSNEFGLQVIVSTHSPHMLSCDSPSANILLERTGNRQTEIVDTSNPNWMEPFATALGINSESFGDWKEIIFSKQEEIILVEGEIDKDYIIDLMSEKHGENRLNFDGEIFAYGGEGFLSNELIVKFILSRFSKVLVTYDLDFEKQNSKRLEKLGLKKDTDYFAVGLNQPGKKCIEGLLPDRIMSEVATMDPVLVGYAATNEEGSKDARQKLKRIKQGVFFEKCNPNTDEYKHFYDLSRKIEKSFSKKKLAR